MRDRAWRERGRWRGRSPDASDLILASGTGWVGDIEVSEWQIWSQFLLHH